MLLRSLRTEIERLQIRPITGTLRGFPVTVAPGGEQVFLGKEGVTVPHLNAVLFHGTLYCSPQAWEQLVTEYGAVADPDPLA